ncbi:mavicyanin-like [Sesamum indicum]|uniref:Mavicyanin-like n=1 Tax=Sesamum indicum TaxID=4182 RepID=A0A6I9SS24_SESIN|nr:mavicyanin-like [Sesamum indicum]
MVIKRVMLLLIVNMIIISGVCNGEVYKVGESSGWTNIAPLHYKSWAASKKFRVGDIILFEYNKQFHNVVRVTHKNFNACNSTSPYATWATGNDSFTVTRPGHFYFICGFPGHCHSGQKVDIRVPRDHDHGPTPGPLPSGLSPQSPPISGPSPRSPSSVPPVQSPTSGCSSLTSWKLWALVVAVGLSAAF